MFPIIVRNAARAPDHLEYSRGRAVDRSSELPGEPGPRHESRWYNEHYRGAAQRRQTHRRDAVEKRL
jgi:hypothetical protein